MHKNWRWISVYLMTILERHFSYPILSLLNLTLVKYLCGIPWKSMEFIEIHGIRSLNFIRLFRVIFSSQQHVTEGVITTWSNRMTEFRLWNSTFHGVSMEFFEKPCSSMEFNVMAWNMLKFLFLSSTISQKLARITRCAKWIERYKLYLWRKWAAPSDRSITHGLFPQGWMLRETWGAQSSMRQLLRDPMFCFYLTVCEVF